MKWPGLMGDLAGLTQLEINRILSRESRTPAEQGRDREAANVSEITRDIIESVKREGDTALKALAHRLDNVDPAATFSIEVPKELWKAALDSLDPDLRNALERAARNIRTVHEAFMPQPVEVSPEPGIRIGRRPDPLNRVGVYAPGGRATYPSSVLMGAIPARAAGVNEVVLCSPPDSSGLPSRVLLAAAEIAQVDRVFAVGGAGAIAALAYGTETIPAVDRIVGPGNAFVAEAKLQVSDRVAIDSPAGPSELLVIADESCSPDIIAYEMLAQAEHDPDAVVITVALSDRIAADIALAVGNLLPTAERRDIIEASLLCHGAILTASSLEVAAQFSNTFAPEHLMVAVENPEGALPLLKNAGTVFIGCSSSVAFGDYMSGANHVLPTGGLARSYSGLSTLDFIRWTTYQVIDRPAAESLAQDVGIFADSEGLYAHAATARQWENSNRKY